MKKLLKNNLALKIISVLVAMLIWYVVVEVSDPIRPQTYDIPVNITHANYIETGKKTYRIDDQYKTIKVTIRDNRTALSKIKEADIVAEADLTQIVDMNTSPVYVPVTVSCPGIKAENISLSRTTIPIIIEDIEQQTFNIDVDTGDTVPGQDYEVGKITLNPKTVTITGPKSIIRKIDRVKAEVSVDGMTQDGEKTANLVIYDKNGEPVTSDMGYLRFDIGSTPVQASVDLWKKAKVKINIELEGSPARGYQVGEIITSPSEITVVGTDEALAELEQNGNQLTIPVSKDVVDIKNQKSDVRGTLELNNVFEKDGTIRPSESTTAIVINVTILPNGSKEFDLDVEAIKTNGLGENMSLSYDQPTLPIRIKASDDLLEAFVPASMIDASIDLTGKGEGDYPVDVAIKLPEGYELVDSLKTTVHLKEKVQGTNTGP